MFMIQTTRERWRQMSQRERRIVLLGGAVAGFALIFVIIGDPLLTIVERLDRQAVRKQKDIMELARLGQDYAMKREHLVEVERRMPAPESRFSLLTFMEEATMTVGVREWMTSMQPQVQLLTQGYQGTVVELRLEGVQLPELLDLLLVIEQAPYDIRVRHLQVRPKFNNPVYLDVNLRVLSYAKG